MEGLTEQEYTTLLERLEEEFSEYYELAGGKNYRYHHLVRTHRYVKKLVEKPEIRDLEFNLKVLEVAALFHDIGRTEDIEDGYLDPIEAHEGHAETGREIVEQFIDDILSEEQVEEVKQVIGNHHSRPEKVETRIVRDADRLGLFGPLNLWRMIHYASDKERPLEDSIEYFWGEGREQKKERFDELNYECSKKIARKRMEKAEETMKTIEEEHLGKDI